MTREYAEAAHAEAVENCTKFRAVMNAARVGSRKWSEAEEDLNFWQGKAANMAAALSLMGST